MLKGSSLFKCGGSQHEIVLTHRDIHLLDGKYFFGAVNPGWHYKKLFGVDFIAGMGVPPTGECLRTFERWKLIEDLKALLVGLRTQEDLISYSYQYMFTSPKDVHHKGMHGGAMAGVHVRGYSGIISVRPSGYCDLVLFQTGPNGMGRIVEIIDMRVRQQIETEDQGILKIRRRRADVGWFEELPKLINFLESSNSDTVELFL